MKLSYNSRPRVDDQNFTYFVTLVFNRCETIDSARKKLRMFHQKLDRKILGVDWYKKPHDQRTFFIAFPEHIASNLHYHLLVKVRDEYKGRFEEHAPSVWEGLVKSGSINIQEIYDERGLISYCVKEQHKNQNFQSFIISTEFSSK